MTSVQTTLFKSNQTQAVRLPKKVALPEHIKKVTVVAVGNTRVITPVGQSWDEWFDNPDISDDFMAEREQPADQIRRNL